MAVHALAMRGRSNDFDRTGGGKTMSAKELQVQQEGRQALGEAEKRGF